MGRGKLGLGWNLGAALDRLTFIKNFQNVGDSSRPTVTQVYILQSKHEGILVRVCGINLHFQVNEAINLFR